jgi:trigger factor
VGTTVSLEAENAPGGPVTLEVTVKLVREKILPEADDEWASEASEFDTLEELRDDLRTRLAAQTRSRAQSALREKAIEALVELVVEEPPASLVEEALHERLHNFDERLKSMKLTLDSYLSAMNQSQEAFVEDQRGHAAVSVKTDLALRALADAESIEVDDDELDLELRRLAAAGGRPFDDFKRRVERAGRMPELRSDVRRARSVDWLVEHVGAVDEQGNAVDRALLLEEDAGGRESDAPTGRLDAGEDTGADEGDTPSDAEEA